MVAIAVFTLGGTIAMRDEGNGARPALGPDDLLAGLGLDQSGIDLRAEAVANLPSGHLTLDHIYDLAGRIRTAFTLGVHGVVVTQGTDTLEETAFALDILVGGDAPVIVTGAMRPASALGADGPANLRAAILAASDPRSRGRGVVTLLNDTVHAARDVTKGHTSRLDAFRARDGGMLGLMREGRIDWQKHGKRSATLPLPQSARSQVPLITTYMGDEGAGLKAVSGVAFAGLVIEGFGGGHVPPALIETLTVIAAEKPVVLATRCRDGSVLKRSYDYAGSEMDLMARGLISAGSLSGLKARLALAVLLDGKASQSDIRAFFRLQDNDLHI